MSKARFSLPRQLSSRPWLAPLSILLAAAGLRSLFLLYPPMDSDQATTGLMGLAILRGDFPVFFFGQDHCGSIEAFLAAPLFYLFGVSRHTLNLAPVLVSLGFVWVVFLAARDMWGRRAGLWAMAFAAFPPFYFMWHNVLPRAAYIEIPLFAVLLAWLTFRLVHRERRGLTYFLWGLVAGVGWWTHPMMIYFLAPCGLYLATAGWRALLSPWLLALGAGLLLGGAPWWYYNLVNDWASLRFLAGAKPGGLPFWRAFLGFFERPLPVVLGAYKDWVREPVIPVFSYFMWAMGLAAGLWLLWKRARGFLGLARFSGREADGSEIFILMGGAVLAVAAYGGTDPDGSVRHLAPLYAAIIPLAGYLAGSLWQNRPGLAAGLALLALASNLYGSVALANFMDPAARADQRREVAQARELAAFLNRKGVKYAYSHNYWQGPKFSFDSAERLVLITPMAQRQREQVDGLLAAPKTALVGNGGSEAQAIRATLKLMGAGWKEGQAGGMIAFYDIKPARPAGAILKAEGFGGSGRPNREDIAQAWDGNASTRWFSLGPQKPGQQFTLDLGREVVGVCRLMLLAGLDTDQPLGLLVEGSRDGQNFSELTRYQDAWWPLVWAGGKPVALKRPSWQEMRFAPTTLRYLRLTQTVKTRVWNWTIMEMLLGAARGEAGEPAALEPKAAAAWIAAQVQAGPVIAEPWLAAFLPRHLRWEPLSKRRPAWLREYLDPDLLLPRDRELVFAVREEFLPPARAALAGAGWKAAVEARFGVALIRATPPAARPPAKFIAKGVSPQKDGDGLLIDLGRPRKVGGLVFHGDRYSFLTPDALALSAKGEDGRFLPLPFRFQWPGRLYWAGLFPLAAAPYPARADLPPLTARYIRLKKRVPAGGALPGILKVDVLAPAGE